MKFQIVLLMCLLLYLIDVNASFMEFNATAKIIGTVKKDCDDDNKGKPKPKDSCEDDNTGSQNNDNSDDTPGKSDECEDDKPASKQVDNCDDGKKKQPAINKSKDNIWSAKGKNNCTFVIPAIAPAPRDIEQIVTFLKAQIGDESILCNIAWSEIEIAEKTAEMAKGYKFEEVRMTGMQLMKKHGFNPVAQTLVTEDGYILTIHRLCGNKNGEPVLLMNSLLGSTDDYITPGINCLAYDLSRAGYDVWFGNARGNKYSRKHKHISPKCQEFWDFSWDEIGRYDLPAIIDYILKSTGRKKLHYIGWSQGTTSFFVMCSERPEYNDKIACMHALSPVVFMKHCRSPIVRLLGLSTDVVYTVAKLIGVNEVSPKRGFTTIASKVVCAPNPISTIVCSNFLLIATGFDVGQLNFTNLPINIGHTPSGSSTKQCIHYGQGIGSGKFRNFDYGKQKNKEVYGCDEPPDYPLHKVTAPVVLHYGTEDWLASLTDIDRLCKELPNVVHHNCIDKYNHMDYVWASNAKELVNNKVLNLIKQYPLDSDRDECGG